MKKIHSITLRICENRLHQAKAFVLKIFQAYNMETVGLGSNESLRTVKLSMLFEKSFFKWSNSDLISLFILFKSPLCFIRYKAYSITKKPKKKNEGRKS